MSTVTKKKGLKKPDWIPSKNISSSLSIVEGIHIFPDLSFERDKESLRVLLWLGKKNDGFGKMIEFPELLTSECLEKLPRRNMIFYLPDMLNSADWEEYLEKGVLQVLLPRFNVEICSSMNSPKRDIVVIELSIEGLSYEGSLDIPLSELSGFLEAEPLSYDE